MTSKFRQAAIAQFQRFKLNTAGVAAIEFAFLLPILVILMLGVTEASHAIIAHKRFQKAVSMMGDLVSREDTIGSDVSSAQGTMNGMMEAAKQAMYPYNIATLKMGITAIKADPNTGAQTVAWSYSYNSFPVTACSGSKSMPAAGMITNGNSAVLVEAQYTYTPIISGLVPGFGGNLIFNDKIANAPRGQCPDYAGKKCTTC